MKLGPGDPHAGTDHSPDLGEIDFGEDSPSVIEQSLMRYADRSTQNLVDEAQRVQNPNAVGWEIQARTRRRPRRCTLDDLRGEALLLKRSPERETTDAGTDNENA